MENEAWVGLPPAVVRMRARMRATADLANRAAVSKMVADHVRWCRENDVSVQPQIAGIMASDDKVAMYSDEVDEWRKQLERLRERVAVGAIVEVPPPPTFLDRWYKKARL